MPLELRAVRNADIPAITAIYAEQIAGVNTYEYKAPSLDEMRARVSAIVDAGYPYLVAELDGVVARATPMQAHFARAPDIAGRWRTRSTCPQRCRAAALAKRCWAS